MTDAAVLQTGETRLRSIFAAMAEGFTVQTITGVIVDANAAAEKILGLSRDQLLGRASMDPRWRSIHEDGSPFPGQDHPSMVTLRTGQALRNQVMGLEIPGVGLRWISINSQPIANDGGAESAAVVTSFIDITERRNLEQQVAASSREIKDLYDNAPCGYHSLDANGIFVQVNATELEWLGCQREDVIGKLSIMDFLKEDGRALYRIEYPVFMQTGRIDSLSLELVGRHGLGRHVALSATAIKDASGRFLRSRAVMFDVTELRRVQGVLLDVISAEQERLGRDLHDGPGQELTGLAMLASAAASSLKKTGRAEAAQIDDIVNIANQAVRNCRAIAHGMSPLIFVDGSLVGALQEMTKLQRDSFGIDAQCEVIEAAPLKLGQVALENLFRISQEAVANARRHGQAKSIRLTLNIQPTNVRLTIADDGIGLMQAAATPSGMGLKIMEYRAGLIGARLTIKPGEHSGTQVTVKCPQPLEEHGA